MYKLYSLLIGYLFGCFLTAIVVGKYLGINVREIDDENPHHGNPGMANVMINVGFKAGLLVFIGDSLKCFLALGLCYLFFYKYIGSLTLLYGGLGTILGHNFPFWCLGKGGKGVMATAVMLVMVMPVYSFLSLLIAAVVVLITGYLNLAAVVFPFIATFFAFGYKGLEFGFVILITAIIMLIKNFHDLVSISKGQIRKVRFFQKKKDV